MSKYPIIPCMPSNDGTDWQFWCAHCQVLHVHSAGHGHRARHCHSDAGHAAFPNGYVLELNPNGYLADLEKHVIVTWHNLIKIEPRLKQLYSEVQAIKDDHTTRAFCANDVWYGYNGNPGFKEPMSRLVGFNAASTDPRIRTMKAYNTAYDKLYQALPDCRNCCCM
jgi:hypothetical protein